MTEFDLTRILTGSEGTWPLLPKRDWILRACLKYAVCERQI